MHASAFDGFVTAMKRITVPAVPTERTAALPNCSYEILNVLTERSLNT